MEPIDEAEALEVSLLLEAIFVRYGYDLREYTRATLRRRVLSMLARLGMQHLGELQHKIVTDPAFFASIVDDLTVHVSEMFRDPSFYRVFRERVIPVLRTYPLLRIWHAGCASGEEAFASAIMLSEAGLYDRAQIYATDLSERAVAEAKDGVFAAERLAVFARNYRDAAGGCDFSNYYTAAYDRIAMKESLRRNLLFFQHDLVSDHVFGEMHVIFCRNVFIYFGADLRNRVLDKFAQSLCAGGFLCLGSSERISTARRDFNEFVAEEHIYRHA